MRLLTLLVLFIPLVVCAQTRYDSGSKKLYKQAVKEYKNGNQEAALDLFQRCVKAEPRYAEAYLNISIIQLGRKRMGDALKNAKKAYAQNRFEPSIYVQLGKCYYQTMNFDSSGYFLSKGIEMGIGDEFSLIYAGKSYNMLRDFTRAKTYLEKAIAVNPKNPAAFNARGKVYVNTGEYDKAIGDFKTTLELKPGSTGLYANLANASLLNEKPGEALEYINLGIEKAEGQEKIQFLILLGNYYHLSGDYEQALDVYDRTLQLDKGNTFILNNQAAVYLGQDKFDSAIEKCNEALELEPEMMEAYFNRGIANEMLRNVEEACSDWEQAFILGSEKAEDYLNSATCNE